MMTRCTSVRRSSDSLVPIITLSLLFAVVSAAPGVNFTTTSNPQERGVSGLLGSLASKTLSAFVRAASYICQWLPQLPEWMRPPKPTLRVAQPAKVLLDDDDFSSEELDFEQSYG